MNPLADLTPEQLTSLADDAAKRATPDNHDSILLAVALRHAAMASRDALAYRRYLMNGKVTEAMLARRFVSLPAVSVRDDGPKIGWVVLVHCDDISGQKLAGGGEPYTQEQAERIAGWFWEFGAHVLEHAKQKTDPDRSGPRRTAAETYERLSRIGQFDSRSRRALDAAHALAQIPSSHRHEAEAVRLRETYDVCSNPMDDFADSIASYISCNRIVRN
jgi:hypothetical protein